MDRESRDEMIEAMVKKGLKVRDVADVVHLSTQRIYQILVKRGVEIPKGDGETESSDEGVAA